MADTKKEGIHPIVRAYVSGFFDGRISIPKTGHVMRSDFSDKAQAERFFESTGKLGKLSELPPAQKQALLPRYRWETFSLEDSHAMLLLVLPLLSPTKRRLATDLLARIERSPAWLKKGLKTVTK